MCFYLPKGRIPFDYFNRSVYSVDLCALYNKKLFVLQVVHGKCYDHS